MTRLLAVMTVALTILVFLSPESDAGKDNKAKKKVEAKADNKVDVTGVITEVHRDGNPKDKDIGQIVVKTAGKSVKITVLKSTDIRRDGKEVPFKALDKGDHVGVYTKNNMPNVADKIVIRKE